MSTVLGVIEVPQLAWLFVRRAESIRLTRLTLGATLLVYGPGTTEHSHHFDTDATLEEFRGWYHRRLIEEGWMLQYTDERRKEQRMPPGQERRRARDKAS